MVNVRAPEDAESWRVSDQAKRMNNVSMPVMAAHCLIAGEGIFCLRNPTTALTDHRKLRKRKWVIRFQFHDLFRVGDRFVKATQLLHDDGECRM